MLLKILDGVSKFFLFPILQIGFDDLKTILFDQKTFSCRCIVEESCVQFFFYSVPLSTFFVCVCLVQTQSVD